MTIAQDHIADGREHTRMTTINVRAGDFGTDPDPDEGEA